MHKKMEYNKVFLENGHECDLKLKQDVLWLFYPGDRCGTRFCRRIQKFFTISETNLKSRKFLRSQATIKSEKLRHLQSHRSIVHPFSFARTIWEMVMVFVYLSFAIVYPFCIACNSYLSDIKSAWIFWCSCETIVFLFFWFDILFTFNVGYYDKLKEEVVLSRKKVAWHYITGYFFVDCVSSLPYRLLPIIFQYFGFLKIFRIYTFIDYRNTVYATLKIDIVINILMNLGTLLLIFLHWSTCLLFILGRTFSSNSNFFISPKIAITSKTDDTLSEIDFLLPSTVNITLSGKYTRMFYTAAYLIARGGNSVPYRCILEIVIISVIVWLGSLFYCAVYIAQLIQIKKATTSSQLKYQEMMQQLGNYMQIKQLSASMQHRLMQYYEFRFQKYYFRENEILSVVSHQLRQEIMLHNCQKLVENVTFFKNLPLSLLIRIVSCLRLEIFLTNDVIIRAHTTGSSMYFISSGTVAVFTSSGKEVCHLEDGAHFGEVALITRDEKRIASVVAVEISELYKLERKDFIRAIQPYPDLLENIERIATERFEHTTLIDLKNRFYNL